MKLDNINVIKTSMMVLVVLYHSCLFFSGHWFTKVEPTFNNTNIVEFAYWLNTFHVPAFVMASGYLFYYIRYEKGKYRSAFGDIVKRWRRLILTSYIICFFWITPIYIYFYGFNFSIIVKKFVLLNSPAQLWFMPMLFCVFLIFYIFSDSIPLSPYLLIPLPTVCVIIGGFLGRFAITSFWCINKSFYYMPYFFLGGLLWKYCRSLKLSHCVFAVIGAIVMHFCYSTNPKDTLLLKCLGVFCNISFSLFEVFVVFFVFSNIKFFLLNISFPQWLKRLVNELNNNSFGIYLFHEQIVYFCIVWLNGAVQPWLLVMITFFVTITISWGIVKILKSSEKIKALLSI